MTARRGVEPIRFRHWEPLLDVVKVRIVGYRAWCVCGWRGPNRRQWSYARADQRWHDCLEVVDAGAEIDEDSRMPASELAAEVAPPPREPEPR